MDALSRIKTDLLHPEFLRRLRTCLEACAARGAVYVVTTGFRSIPEQGRLFFLGRTLAGAKVTNARPGYSFHNYGLAADCAYDGSPAPGLQPDWATARYAVLREEGERAGLQVGVKGLGDAGHVQLPLGTLTGRREFDLCHELRAVGGLEDAWRLVEQWLAMKTV